MNFLGRFAKPALTILGLLGIVVIGLVLLAASFLADLATKIPPTARPSLNPARMGLVCEEVELRS
ncbi:MAG: hypothetical protein ACKODZ_06250, partial [Verrucomicrobiota bacterium]